MTHPEPTMLDRLRGVAAEAMVGREMVIITQAAVDAAVRAVLEALRTPSEGMVEAGEDVPMIALGNGDYVYPPVRDTFTAMIEHVMKEGDT